MRLANKRLTIGIDIRGYFLGSEPKYAPMGSYAGNKKALQLNRCSELFQGSRKNFGAESFGAMVDILVQFVKA